MIPSTHRDAAIHIRAKTHQRDLIDKASTFLGKTRTDFMLDTACREAEHVLLDRQSFVLNQEQWKQCIEILDAPTKPISQLRKLLSTPSVWETEESEAYAPND